MKGSTKYLIARVLSLFKLHKLDERLKVLSMSFESQVWQPTPVIPSL